MTGGGRDGGGGGGGVTGVGVGSGGGGGVGVTFSSICSQASLNPSFGQGAAFANVARFAIAHFPVQTHYRIEHAISDGHHPSAGAT